MTSNEKTEIGGISGRGENGMREKKRRDYSLSIVKQGFIVGSETNHFFFFLKKTYNEQKEEMQLDKDSNESKSINEAKWYTPKCDLCEVEMDPTDAFIQCVECSQRKEKESGEKEWTWKHRSMICGDCYVHGRETKYHKKFHCYQIIPPILPLCCPSSTTKEEKSEEISSSSTQKKKKSKNEPQRWSLREEWNLIHGMSKRYGIGNWDLLKQEQLKQFNDRKYHFNKKYKKDHFYYHSHSNNNNSNNNNNNNGNDNDNDNSNNNNNNNNIDKHTKKMTSNKKSKTHNQ
ncbi:hypothetical protein RFI_00567 [Reticulomyxa filosa]|uniref:Uncharacterized protein n=1 Tax=Reticulomyxa filosa TaxID=46433 RepID=X6PDD9_RETFI|nr:hypothetical protein RFI_00567 [Reticulomyxa filosa]|eukprot:ETO36500.1 hypothetical protein RFI_00567 [Reticulomyxa filosa]